MQTNERREFCGEYDLKTARETTLKKPAAHQAMAIDHLIKWYNGHPNGYAGGILVLPTGGGKTFTSIRFVCRTALSEGYKVLWLAHTHHLLEQAYFSFRDHVGAISEPKSTLKVRVVSGTIGHFRIPDIQSDDDVVIATLQTVTGAYNNDHFALKSFIDSAKGKLFVVFDEAHHAPAPSYRKLITSLRDRCKDMHLLGLTATPVYSDESQQGWMFKLFQQGILYQVTPQSLMAQGILAKPIREQQKTNFTPNFDLREYQKWVGTFHDIPEEIITQLAENKDRNMFIAEQYSRNKERYGKTLIFADRWYQCEAIAEQLRKRGIRAGSVYSHIDAGLKSANARNKRKSDENAQILDAFRRNELDVVLNVRMLTEGTDIPDVNTCFITRQTTSKILMTQMVGRALRGPKFGGTSEANLVFFTDEWEHLINWADYDLIDGPAGNDEIDYGKRPPVRYISIELVRKLASQMDSGVNINPEPFLRLLPKGWYKVEYAATQSDSEEIEYIQRLVMVFENEVDGYEQLINVLQTNDNSKFYSEEVQLKDVLHEVEEFRRSYFSNDQKHFGSDLSQDIFSIARHIAQKNTAPRFFNFEERKLHDLDMVSEDLMAKDLSRTQEDNALQLEFNRLDRYWQVLYITYELFKSQYNACAERILHARRHGAEPESHIIIVKTSTPSNGEPSDELKRQVKERDRGCLCCHSKRDRYLEVDHIVPKYFGGNNILDNLQTLCDKCNQFKGTERINFRDCQTDLTQPIECLPEINMPTGKFAGSPESWAEFLNRVINFFYRCSAVHAITIGMRGDSFYNWRIELNAGNDPKWLEPHLGVMMDRITGAKKTGGYAIPTSITISSPDLPEVKYTRHMSNTK